MRRITRIVILLLTVALLLCARRPGTPPPLPIEAPQRPATLVFTGDILLAGRVGTAIATNGAAVLFEGVSKVLSSADLAIGNLECPLATTGEPQSKEYTFRARPESAAALTSAGFDVVTLANNHTVDYGTPALLETMAALKKHHVRSVGAGKDIDGARRAVIIQAGSPPVRIAILAFSNMEPTSFYARADRPGTNPAYPARIKTDVAAARSRADFVVVLFHWGDELSQAPSASQRYLARVAVDAGAGLVIGHHPHVLQGMEKRGNSLIAYSLGNFVFPSRGEAKRTMMLRYTVGRDGSRSAEVIPCVIDGFRPTIATGAARRKIMAEVGRMSEKQGLSIPADGVIALHR
jgi:poly-gamma-glutamate synthesis protein (capsule biosynthesis protein)